MTRPKVDPDKRQRTAQACDSCKRRKQKCNGLSPCNTCTKRHLTCEYTGPSQHDQAPQEGAPSSAKRRQAGEQLNGSRLRPQGPVSPAIQQLRALGPSGAWSQSAPVLGLGVANSELSGRPLKKSQKFSEVQPALHEYDVESRSGMSSIGLTVDEAEMYPQSRMLQDSTGRLLYVGESASISYLQLLRLMVDNLIGASPFTLDPRRHMILENVISMPLDSRPTGVLPDRQTAGILIESFFRNTMGFVDVLDQSTFMQTVDEFYKDSFGTNSSHLCLIYLVLAIGLAIAKPPVGRFEDPIITKLTIERSVRAEQLFRFAKSLADPVSGFEDADFWSTQALVLMSIYMLAISKRNAAHAYHGMAVRSAFALGLHREEAMAVFTDDEQKVRKNLWRTLFILDRYLAASLGRPTAISDHDSSDNALYSLPNEITGPSLGQEHLNSAALDSAVSSCSIIGDILKEVYAKRKVSTAVAQEISKSFCTWNEKLHPKLHWRQVFSSNCHNVQGIAIVHINLLQCHAATLLTRPFFIWMINKARECRLYPRVKLPRLSQRMDVFAKTCVEAAHHSLVIAQAAFERSLLSQCNPFVLYFVFSSALIILSNEFASLYRNPDAEKAISTATHILNYCADEDPQAERTLYIINTLHDVVKKQADDESIARLSFPGRKIPIINTASQNNPVDSMSAFFQVPDSISRPEAPRRKSQSLYGPSRQSVLMPLASKEHQIPPKPADFPRAPPTPVMSTIQQGSPNNSASSAISGMGPVATLETTSAGESEFDLDSLWNTWHSSAGETPASTQPLQPSSMDYPSSGLNVNVAPYAPSTYR